jgi:2-polyprenyl-3-methyl-5-hydroxy-6-metoxy-1,4-benzoquinol methylase
MIYLLANNEAEYRQWIEDQQQLEADVTWVRHLDQMVRIIQMGEPLESNYLIEVNPEYFSDDLKQIKQIYLSAAYRPKSRYFINPFYRHRSVAIQSVSEIFIKDECQDQTYSHAYDVYDRNGYMSVLDFGCGGGYKLMKYFGDVDAPYIIGMDTATTVEWLKREYPNRVWINSALYARHRWDMVRSAPMGIDLLIASDVIEHLPDPDLFLDFVQHIRPRKFIFSTPNRERLQEMFMTGPPRNHAHYREWTFREFGDYIESRFVIEEHIEPVEGDCTQILVGKLR